MPAVLKGSKRITGISQRCTEKEWWLFQTKYLGWYSLICTASKLALEAGSKLPSKRRRDDLQYILTE